MIEFLILRGCLKSQRLSRIVLWPIGHNWYWFSRYVAQNIENLRTFSAELGTYSV
jgi:hypothetical protein